MNGQKDKRWLPDTGLFPEGLCRLPADHGCFASAAPVIFAGFAGRSNDPVTGYQEGDRVTADSGSYSPRRSRISDLTGDMGIGGKPAHGDIEQRFPYFQLKMSSFQVKFYFGQLAPILSEKIQCILLGHIHCLAIPGFRKLL